MEVTRAGGGLWFCSCISTSESMFCIDECQDKRPRGRRLTDDSSGNTKLRKAKEPRVSKGESRDKGGKLERENQRKREKMPKKEISGGEEERRQSKEDKASEQGKHGPCAGNYHLGVSRNLLLLVTIQSLSCIGRGKFLLLLSHPARKHVGLALTTRCGESTSRVSILGLLER